MIHVIERFRDKKVLIVGDVMIDAYIMGKVDRISPEAPVPVVNIEKYDKRLGGAANVALNILALRAVPMLCTVIGNDDEGNEFLRLLTEKGMPQSAVLQSGERKTTVKTRIIGNKHQLLRLDQEQTNDLTATENSMLLDQFRSHVDECDVVILEDYNKGVLNESNIAELIRIANEAGKPIAVDPKKKNFLSYTSVTLFKPNLKEIKEGLNTDMNLKDRKNLKQAVQELHAIIRNDYTMVTLSEDGVMISDHNDYEFIPAHVRNISDVSGAGDTVISVAALCLACNVGMRETAALSNLAGGLVCEESGVVPVNIERLKEESAYLFTGSR